MPDNIIQTLMKSVGGGGAGKDENSYQSWVAFWKQKTPDAPPEESYDYRKAFVEGATPKMGPDGHYVWPAQYNKAAIRDSQKGMKLQTIMERADKLTQE